jgi:hypothetical protein
MENPKLNRTVFVGDTHNKGRNPCLKCNIAQKQGENLRNFVLKLRFAASKLAKNHDPI